jgi:hypothetical protein
MGMKCFAEAELLKAALLLCRAFLSFRARTAARRPREGPLRAPLRVVWRRGHRSESQEAYRTACRQPDGSWRTVQ